MNEKQGLIENLEVFTTELLHINDVAKNKLLDLEAEDRGKTYYLSRDDRESISRYMLDLIGEKLGKPGNTALHGSALEAAREQHIGRGVNIVEWKAANGTRDVKKLHGFIEGVYKELSQKGNNPLFLSVGAIHVEVPLANEEIKRVKMPLLIFPIRLVRTGTLNTPIYIEFIDDDIYINPCLVAKLRSMWGATGDEILKSFPHPNGPGVDIDEPVILSRLGDGEQYFSRVAQYVEAQRRSESSVFFLERDVVAIAEYAHGDLCMYYDIKRNKQKLYASAQTERIFAKHDTFLPSPTSNVAVQYVLPHDSAQTRMIERVVRGESLVIKGPPGTGKTLTITNMVAALMAAGKRVMLSSQKTAAMAEVYAKLPEKLRQFVMLLDCETEAQAARLNPSEIRREFNALLHYAASFKPELSVHDDWKSGVREREQSAGVINDYKRATFDVCDVLGYSYYDALNVCCKINARPVPFAKPQDALALSRADYLALQESVDAAASYFERISHGHTVERSPWMPSSGSLEGVDTERALADYGKLAGKSASLLESLREACKSLLIDVDKLSLYTLRALLKTSLTKEQAEYIGAKEREGVLGNIADKVTLLRQAKACSRSITLKGERAVLRECSLYGAAEWDKGLRIDDLLRINEHWDVVESFKDPVRLRLLADFRKLRERTEQEIDRYRDELYGIFRREELGEMLEKAAYKTLVEAAAAFERYDPDHAPEAPKLFDFKGKKLYESLAGLGYGDRISFADVIRGAGYAARIEQLCEEMRKERALFGSRLRYTITDDQLDAVCAVAARALSCGCSIGEYLASLSEYVERVVAVCSVLSYPQETTLQEIYEFLYRDRLSAELDDALRVFMRGTELFDDWKGKEQLDLAEGVLAVYEAMQGTQLGHTPEQVTESAEALRLACSVHLDALCSLIDDLLAFGTHRFRGYFTATLNGVLLGELEILIKEATDRDIVHAVGEYLAIIYSRSHSATVRLDQFFRPFEVGVRSLEGYTFPQHFEHSVFSLAVQAKMEKMGNLRYGVGERITRELTEWERAEARVAGATLKLIEQQCVARINPKDPDLAFLSAERPNGETLRRLFKEHAREIMKLKRCFILSPATVSVLFREPEFAEFDVVIVDEASQLTPTAILPLLFRAKQVVLVGDEWQMPPIKHFVTRTQQSADAEGEVSYMTPDMSVLGLALANCAFPAEHLVCHYRSRTESLIMFSQKRFYEHMRTFPTTTPKGVGLGFKDVYLPDACCEKAVNKAEAAQVVAELNAHFDKYYQDGRLTESVGVVAFGEKQIAEIESQVRRDKKLYDRIQTAISNFEDLPEKLIFFKTILTVQGQEIDHLILSLTYGKSKDGKIVQAFGELNKGVGENKLGQCIFNVAVTRAKSSVTVIHSVTAQEITNKNISFIADYLSIVESFGSDKGDQFVGMRLQYAEPGFLRQVAEFVRSCGIDESRIVLNFGVTEGSVRIPIAILSEDRSRALLGIWCETDPKNRYDYFDYQSRYFRVLEGDTRGWRLHRVYIQDWIDNGEATRSQLREAILKIM